MIAQKLFLGFLYALHFASCHDFKGFDDTIQFKINWPGKLDDSVLVSFL